MCCGGVSECEYGLVVCCMKEIGEQGGIKHASPVMMMGMCGL